MKREIIKFETCKEANKGVLSYMKEKNKNHQKRFGHVVENNLLVAFNEYQEANHIKVKKTSIEEDYMFGADFWLACTNPKDSKVDNMSSYLDLTTNKFKKGIQWFGYYNSDIAKQPYIKKAKEAPSCFGFLNNGAKIHFGIKRWHNNKFEYKKPVVVIYIATDQMTEDIQFTSNDIAYIMKNLRRVIYYVSYKMKSKFAGKEIQGYGKRASKLISPSYEYLQHLSIE